MPVSVCAVFLDVFSGRKMLNREVLKISECLRTDQTPLGQLLCTGIFCGLAWGFWIPVGTGGDVPTAVVLCVVAV